MMYVHAHARHCMNMVNGCEIRPNINRRAGLRVLYYYNNYRMAQPTQWVPAILDYMKKAKLSISTMVLALISNYDS